MIVGLDLGSRSIKLVALDGGTVAAWAVEPSGFNPKEQALAMLSRYPGARVSATGYGRHLAAKHFDGEALTEIKAHALGVRHHHPECRTIVDVGGQDAKVIVLDEKGRVDRFQMNDKCAAGTGRFLEIMAATLGYSLEEFGEAASRSTHTAAINSMCAVFAESEVISLKNGGSEAGDIARAIHLSVVDRLHGMLERIGWKPPLAFSGGVAKSAFIRAELSSRLASPILATENPELLGALGAALHARGKF